jgi:hypothetical protein
MTADRSAVFATQRYKRGRVEGDRLTRALLDAANKGLRPHCSQPETHDYWISEHEGERAQAALWCRRCPEFTPCGQAAEARQEVWGVWASKDFSRRPGQPKPQAE